MDLMPPPDSLHSLIHTPGTSQIIASVVYAIAMAPLSLFESEVLSQSEY